MHQQHGRFVQVNVQVYLIHHNWFGGKFHRIKYTAGTFAEPGINYSEIHVYIKLF